ncbi:MAG: Holliday junction resolvase RuvX [Betaproteobacteria bacterium]
MSRQLVVAATGSAIAQAFPVALPALHAMTDPHNHAAQGTVLAFDFGKKRIGTAIGETAIGIAHPLSTIHAEDKQHRYAAIEAVIREWQPALLVVGLPAHMDGTEHEMSRLARKFAGELAQRFKLPVEFIDERLTSAAAESSLGESGIASHKRKAVVDSVAAQHILQDFLDRTGRPS